MRLPYASFPPPFPTSEDRLAQVAHVLLVGLGAALGIAAIAVAAHALGRGFAFMVEKRWPVAVYTLVAVTVTVVGYVTDSVALYYGIGALLLPLLLLAFLALIGF